MSKTVLIFIPNTLATIKDGYLEGFYKNYGNLEAYYITNNLILDKCNKIVGYCCSSIKSQISNDNIIFIERGHKELKVHITGRIEEQITEIIYDYDAFKHSKVTFSRDKYGMHIRELTQHLYLCEDKKTNSIYGLVNRIFGIWMIFYHILLSFSNFKNILEASVLLSHTINTLKNTTDCLKIIQEERKFSLKIKNIIFAKCLDIMLGILLILLCFKYENYILKYFENFIQEFVVYLRRLLIYLMGSPIGLKLNYSFNHSLGRFFFYHINLWRVFLQAIQSQLGEYFQILLIPGLFGISFEIAIFCDIITIVTFHTYCIYVYAARLFYLQIRGLSALWRLFIGRKYNPLRTRVDSSEYSSNQLFIGTLGFTILLFLLPTTMMYYTVFLMLRLVTVIVKGLMQIFKNISNNIPVYIFIIWIFGSPSLAGNVHIVYQHLRKNGIVKARLTLSSLSLVQCIKVISHYSYPGIESNMIKIISHVFTGKLI